MRSTFAWISKQDWKSRKEAILKDIKDERDSPEPEPEQSDKVKYFAKPTVKPVIVSKSNKENDYDVNEIPYSTGRQYKGVTLPSDHLLTKKVIKQLDMFPIVNVLRLNDEQIAFAEENGYTPALEYSEVDYGFASDFNPTSEIDRVSPNRTFVVQRASDQSSESSSSSDSESSSSDSSSSSESEVDALTHRLERGDTIDDDDDNPNNPKYRKTHVDDHLAVPRVRKPVKKDPDRIKKHRSPSKIKPEKLKPIKAEKGENGKVPKKSSVIAKNTATDSPQCLTLSSSGSDGEITFVGAAEKHRSRSKSPDKKARRVAKGLKENILKNSNKSGYSINRPSSSSNRPGFSLDYHQLKGKGNVSPTKNKPGPLSKRLSDITTQRQQLADKVARAAAALKNQSKNSSSIPTKRIHASGPLFSSSSSSSMRHQSKPTKNKFEVLPGPPGPRSSKRPRASETDFDIHDILNKKRQRHGGSSAMTNPSSSKARDLAASELASTSIGLNSGLLDSHDKPWMPATNATIEKPIATTSAAATNSSTGRLTGKYIPPASELMLKPTKSVKPMTTAPPPKPIVDLTDETQVVAIRPSVDSNYSTRTAGSEYINAIHNQQYLDEQRRIAELEGVTTMERLESVMPYLHVILFWKVDWLKEQKDPAFPPNVSQSEVYPLDLAYLNADQYKAHYAPLLLHEIWAQMYQERDNKKPEVFLAVAEFGTSVCTQFINVTAEIALAAHEYKGGRNDQFPDAGDLVLLELTRITHAPLPPPPNLLDPRFANTAVFQAQMRPVIDKAIYFAYISTVTTVPLNKGPHPPALKVQRSHNIKVRYSIKIAARAIGIDITQLVRVKPLYYLKPMLRQVEAVACIEQSKLCNDILEPSISTCQFAYPPAFDINSDKDFNPSQSKAIQGVNEAIKRHYNTPKIQLIQGPPGTGKTHTLVGIIKKIYMDWKDNDGGSTSSTRGLPRLLVCAPSNGAVDEITRRIYRERHFLQKREKDHQRSLRIVRVGRSESDDPNVKKVTLDELVEQNLKDDCDRKKDDYFRRKNKLDQALADLDIAIAAARNEQRFHDVRHLEREHDQARNELDKHKATHQKIFGGFNNGGYGNFNGQDRDNKRRDIMRNADIILSTLNSSHVTAVEALFNREKGNLFQAVIIDEASQCSEPEALMPLTFGVTKIVMIGDPLQLPATVISPWSLKHKYDQSLFERFYEFHERNNESTNPVLMLTEQYRMHEEICRWPSLKFYKNRLMTCKTIDRRSPLPAYVVIDLKDSTETQGVGTSWMNKTEAVMVKKLIEAIEILIRQESSNKNKFQNRRNNSPRGGGRSGKGGSDLRDRLNQSGKRFISPPRFDNNQRGRNVFTSRSSNPPPPDRISPSPSTSNSSLNADEPPMTKLSSLGVITPYKAQVGCVCGEIQSIRRRVEADGLTLDVRTVDGFQGQEKDIIIYSCVRAQQEGAAEGTTYHGDVGFLRSKQRMNVALTRARFSCIVVLNSAKLSGNDLWRELIEDAGKRNRIIPIKNTHTTQVHNLVSLLRNKRNLLDGPK